MKRTSLLTLLLCVCCWAARAQEIRRCGFDQDRALRLGNHPEQQIAEYKENLRLLDYQRKHFPPGTSGGGGEGLAAINSGAKYIIPVVFHIVHRTTETTPASASGYLNIKDEQVWSQLDYMNAAFAPYNIQFCLAERDVHGNILTKPGITRTANNSLVSHIADSANQMALKVSNVLDFPAQRYLNVWIVGTIYDYPTGDPIAGYYGHPNRRSDLEGIVIAADCFGNNAYYSGGFFLNASYNLGNTMVHELGHYFGLYHPFEGACDSASAADQSTVGDWCFDTPPMKEIKTCATASNSCSESYFPTFPFNRFDLLNNFMGYTEESCLTNFTDSQTVRMWANLEVKRKTLWSNKNIIDTRISCLFRSCFYTSGNITCVGDSITFYTFDLPGLSFSWNFGTGSPVTTTAKSIKFAYSSTGTYNVYLTVTDIATSNSATNTVPLVIQVISCTPLADPQANWYFGNFGGVTFTTAGPRPNYAAYNNATINSPEGGVSISDNNGNLLFYAGGTFEIDTFAIWNRNHQLMKGVDSIYGGSSQQQNIILKDPRDSTLYFLFTVPDEENIRIPGKANGLYYHIIDMDGDGGLGEVVSKNNPVMDTVNTIPIPSNGDGAIRTAEAITAIPFCDDNGYWIILSGHYQDSASTFGKKFFIYKLDTGGLAFHGFYDRSTVFYTTSQIKASPNGNYIAHFSSQPGAGASGAYVEVHSFDKTNGTFVNTRKVEFFWGFGLSFSPNSELLYMSGYSAPFSIVYQMNLKAADLSGAIVPTPSRYNFTESSCLQLGPDGKLYVGYQSYTDEYLHVFDTPDSLITVAAPNACGFREFALDFNPNGNYPYMAPVFNLPNMVDAKSISELPQSIQHQFVSCDSVKFEIPVCGPASWNFGDPASGSNNTSSDRYTGHRFSGFGTYTVTYTGDGGTLTKNITIGIDSPVVSGNRVVCDTGFFYTYSVPPNMNHYYEWYINGVKAKQGLDNTVRIKWIEPGGTIQVRVTDMVKGCSLFSREDSVILRPTVNNISLASSRDTVFTDSIAAPNTITGDIPTTGPYAYSIKWQINRTGSDTQWVDLSPGDSLLNYSAGMVDSFVMYRRVVTLDGTCPNYSAPVIFYRNRIQLYSCPFEKVQLIGGVNNAPFLQGDYSWEFSRDEINWYGLGVNSKDLSIEIPEDTTWFFRRKVQLITGQVHYSNVIEHHQYRIEITSPLPDTVVCRENLQPFDLTLTTNADNSFVAIWEIKPGNSNFWQFNNTGHSLSYTPDDNADIDSIRVTVYSICTPYRPYTKSFRVLKHKQPVLSMTPNFAQVLTDEYNMVRFIATKTDSNSAPLDIRWQYSPNGFTWSTYADTIGDTLDVIPTQCKGNLHYRAYVTNGCYTTYTDPVEVYINRIPDLFIRDTTSDTGNEPNGAIVGSWSSPDIWNRHAADGIKVHQAPRFNNFNENVSTPVYNYLYTMIHNRGEIASQSGELTLYWSRLGSGQVWEKSWSDVASNKWFSPGLGYEIALGGKVNATPITIPSIPAGDSLMIYYQWQPPNAYWYGDWVQFGSSSTGLYQHAGAVEHKLCYLARIETCDEAPFGMRYAEGKSTLDNVKRNNNIAARNEAYRVISFDNDGGTNGGGGPGPRTVWTLLQNQRDRDTIINIRIETDPTFSFNDRGTVFIYLDDALYALFAAAGYQISGATVDSQNPQIYTMDDAVVTISGLSFTDSTMCNIGLDFVPDSLLYQDYYFTVSQWSESEDLPEGGANIILDHIPPPPIQNKRNLGVEEMEIQVNSLKAYPNPTDGNLLLQVDVKGEGAFSARILNSLGQEIKRMDTAHISTGLYTYGVDLSALASGIYYCEMKVGNTTKVEMIVLQR